MMHEELHGPVTTGLQEGQSWTLKHDDTFAIFDHEGDVISRPGNSEGLYNNDTRYLSHFHLALQGSRLKLLSSALSNDDTTLTCDLTNPDFFNHAGELILPQGLFHIRRSRLLWKRSLYERMAVTNFSGTAQHINLELYFASDFADLFQVRGATREKRGQDHPAKVAADEVILSYTGLDREDRRTALHFSPAPTQLMQDCASFDLLLAAKETQLLFIEIGCAMDDAQKQPLSKRFLSALRKAKHSRASAKQKLFITTSNELFNKTINRSLADLAMLTTNLPTGPYPYAGIPWFSTVFGRDALITAWEVLWFDPAVAKGVLQYLADNQATDENAATDAEPGKILHEVRGGEMAALGEVPFRRYYGSIDSTPLFLCLAGAYLQRSGDLAFIRSLRTHLEAAVTWLDLYGDRDGDGLVEYGRRSADGLANQGWKDSQDSIFHADGTLAQGSIALAEVQGYVYGARRAMAYIFGQLGEADAAAKQAAKADALQKLFDEQFFDEALGTYVLALDGNKKPCRIRSSNAGHALFSRIAYPERAASVVKSLMGSSSFSGWGVRTVATTESRYNPMSYHNGSVWPHDNAMIAAGFAHYGFRHEAVRIFEGLFSASGYIDLQRLPELFCGFQRRYGGGPTLYPVACVPQAWAAGAFLSLIQSSLGLAFDPSNNQITFDEPVLPAFLDAITLRRLSVGGKPMDVAFNRLGSRIAVELLPNGN